MAKILIVEDETSIQKLIEYDLKRVGHETVSCMNGDEAIKVFDDNNFDIVLLDYLLPGKTGVEICKYIRTKNSEVYIMLLTAVGDEINKLKAFEYGADDYVVKPFSMNEVIARIERFLQRKGMSSVNLSFLHVQIDDKTRNVFCDGVEVDLTKTEYELLKYLVKNKNSVVEREDILSKVWGYDYIGETRTVDVYAHKLREKLKLDKYLKTVRGVGYILKEE